MVIALSILFAVTITALRYLVMDRVAQLTRPGSNAEHVGDSTTPGWFDAARKAAARHFA